MICSPIESMCYQYIHLSLLHKPFIRTALHSSYLVNFCPECGGDLKFDPVSKIYFARAAGCLLQEKNSEEIRDKRSEQLKDGRKAYMMTIDLVADFEER